MGGWWPGGPIALPVRVVLAETSYIVGAHPTPRLAWAISTGKLLIPALLSDEDHNAVVSMLRDPRSELDLGDCVHASMRLASKLGGIAEGLMGWRAAVKLCGLLITEWASSTAGLIEAGIDPASDPLWKVCAGLYRLHIDHPMADTKAVKSAKARLYAPIAGEPAWPDYAGQKPPIASLSERLATAQSALSKAGGPSLAEAKAAALAKARRFHQAR